MEWKTVINFWFKECTPAQWYKKDAKLDAKIRRKFLKTFEAAVKGELAAWRSSPRGRLAEIIVLDQFARNMFRGTPQAFQYDPLALAWAQEAIRAGADTKLPVKERAFLYMPFMHSESKKIQRDSVRLFRALGSKGNLPYAIDHKKIIDRFGRYPHRNAILGRNSTASERAFMRSHKGY